MTMAMATATATATATAISILGAGRWILAAALLVLMVACGGGGGGGGGGEGGTPPVTSPPAPLSITVQPADRSAVAGSAVSFTVVAQNALGYQWQQTDSADGAAPWRDIPGATEAAYTTPATAAAWSGLRFRVLVRGEGGQVLASTAAALSVTEALVAPRVLVAPQDVSVTAGGTAVFSVTGEGTALSLTWQQSTDGGTTWRDLPAPSLPSLSLPAVRLDDNGSQWRVVLANSLGSAVSAAATLSVQAAPAEPRIVRQPLDRSVTVGQPAVFEVQVAATPAPVLQWSRSVDGVNWSAVAGATGPVLTLPATALADNGLRLRVQASNALGTATSAVATLTVSAAPQAPAFTLEPADSVAVEGARAVFSAAASGVPSPSWQWQTAAPGSDTFVNINGANTGRYETVPLALADDGRRFRVLASNAAGSVASRAATLGVLALSGRPTVLLTPSPDVAGAARLVLRDQPVTVTAVVTGTPAPTLSWQLLGGTQTGTGSSFTVAGPALGQVVTVRATARNAVGSAEAEVRLVGANPIAPGLSGPALNLSGAREVLTGAGITLAGVPEDHPRRGVPAAVQQWQRSRDGGATWEDLPGQTGPDLVLGAVSAMDDRAIYRAQLTNTAGSAVLARYDLLVGDASAPVLTPFSVDLLRAAGSSLGALSALPQMVAGFPRIGALRYEQSADAGASWQAHDPARELSAADEALWFRATAENASGRVDSLPMRLRIVPALDGRPFWRRWPMDVSVPEGAVAVFDAQTFLGPGSSGASREVVVGWQQSDDGGTTWSPATKVLTGAAALKRVESGSTDSPIILRTQAATLADDGRLFRAHVDHRGQRWFTGPARLTVTPAHRFGLRLDLLAGAVGGPGTLDGPRLQSRLSEPRLIGRGADGTQYFVDNSASGWRCWLRQIGSDGRVSSIALPEVIAGAGCDAVAAADGTIHIRGMGLSGRFFQHWRRNPAGAWQLWASEDPADGPAYTPDLRPDLVGYAAAADGALWFIERIPAATGGFDAVCVRRLEAVGTVRTVAGVCGNAGLNLGAPVDGIGAAARFGRVTGLAVAPDGSLVLSDQHGASNHVRIRRVEPGGRVSTVAGGSRPADTRQALGDSDLASALLRAPFGLSVDPAGRIGFIDYAGVECSGEVFVICGLVQPVLRVADPMLDRVRTLAAADGVTQVSSDGEGAWLVSLKGAGASLAGGGWPTAGTLLRPRWDALAGGAGLILRITADGASRLHAGMPFAGGPALDATGAAARFQRPTAVAAAAGGSLWVVDALNCAIRRVSPAGVVGTVAGGSGCGGGQDGTGASARFGYAWGGVVMPDGRLAVADTSNHTIRLVAADGRVTTLAGRNGTAGGNDGDAATARFTAPRALALLPDGTLAVGDAIGVRIVAADGSVRTRWRRPTGLLGTSLGNPSSGSADVGVLALAVHPSGDLIMATYRYGLWRLRGNGAVSPFVGGIAKLGTVLDQDHSERMFGDGPPGRGELAFVTAMAFDAAGRLWLADAGAASLRRVEANGDLVTLIGAPGLALGDRFASGPGTDSMLVGGTTLGTRPTLGWVGGLSLLPDGRVALTSEDAVLLASTP